MRSRGQSRKRQQAQPHALRGGEHACGFGDEADVDGVVRGEACEHEEQRRHHRPRDRLRTGVAGADDRQRKQWELTVAEWPTPASYKAREGALEVLLGGGDEPINGRDTLALVEEPAKPHLGLPWRRTRRRVHPILYSERCVHAAQTIRRTIGEPLRTIDGTRRHEHGVCVHLSHVALHHKDVARHKVGRRCRFIS